MNIDFKVTAWERVEVFCSAKKEKEILKALKVGVIKTSNDLIGLLNDPEADFEYEVIPETETQLTPEENNGHATIEVISPDQDVPVWSNVKQ